MILADAYDAFLLDLDGVIWRGEAPIEGADRAVRVLRDHGPVVFVTNNSSRTPRDCAVKLARMKIPTAPDDVVTSAHAVVDELRRMGVEAGERVHVCGAEGLWRLVSVAGFVPTVEVEPVKAVVVGWNPKLTFDAIRKAADLVRSGVPFLASNRDATYPAEGGVLPGTGAIVAAIEVASGVPCTVAGKPQPHLFRLALERAGVDAGRALFVGDRAETDVVGAAAAGVPCALVLTGVVEEDALVHTAALPDYVVNGLPDLLEDLPHPRVVAWEAGLAAVVDGVEVARLTIELSGNGVVLGGLHVLDRLGHDDAWTVLRRLLVEAVAGYERVRAPEDIAAHLSRLGITAEAPVAEPLTLLDPQPD